MLRGRGFFCYTGESYRFENNALDRKQKEFLTNETFRGNEIVSARFKTVLVNL